MLQLQWELQQPFFTCHNLAVLSFQKLYVIFSHSLSHTLVSPGIATSIIIVSCFTLSTSTISGFLASIMSSYCMVKFHRILTFSFTTTLSGWFSYQSLDLLNPSFSQNGQILIFPTLSCHHLYSHFLYHTSYKGKTCLFCQYCTWYS